ncbi:MAG: hypothetical protein ABEJ04_02110 [Halobacteriaceae archaeon]
MSRRALFAVVAAGVLALAAGCAAPVGSDGARSTAPTTDSPDPAGTVVVWNDGDDAWAVRAVVRRGDDVLANETETVAPGETWRVATVSGGGPFAVSFEFADGPTLSETVDPAGTSEVSVRVQLFGDAASPSVRVYRTLATEETEG